MGICNSCEATSVVTMTAKLIHQDGKLQEFSRPVKVSHVLQKDPTCFVCNSDDMAFDDFVSAINADEELQLGQLYFVLPRSMLRKRLLTEEMAALAVKASTALMRSASAGGRSRCSRISVEPVVFSGEARVNTVVGGGVSGGSAVVGLERRRSRKRSGSGRSFTSNLGAIPEYDS